MTASPMARTPQPESASTQGQSGGPPAVSVIISTYNSGPLLGSAMDALKAQTLPGRLIEILVVDDGSTDGTWPYLNQLESQRTNIKIFQQQHTGGPSAGRNRALTEASGEYVFFHDADDYLGPDALRRLLDLAQQEDSDVVAGRVSWIGRPDVEAAFTKTVPDADILDDGVWRSLTPHKLIRRSLIEHLGLRFCDDMVQGEDQVFMASCLFAARKISIIGDQDLYHRRMLPDGSNLSRQGQTLTNKQLTSSRMVAVVVANTMPGARRDRMLRRVFVRTLPPALNRPFMAAGPAERKEFLDVMRAEVFPYLPHSVLGELEDRQRLRMLTARTGEAKDLLELNRALRSPRYGEGELPTYMLGPQLDQLLSPEDRQVGAPRLPADLILCNASLSRSRLALVVSLEAEAGASIGRVNLGAWLPGTTEFVDLGPETSRVGTTLTFTINIRQLFDEVASSDVPADSKIEHSHRVLLVESQRRGRRVGASPIRWPETLELAAIRFDRKARNPQIQLGATPGGSVMITVRQPKRSPIWHRPRLVV
jgi:poly(ribitol-phosphate) beta-N-acetylglucosaminyltransferase